MSKLTTIPIYLTIVLLLTILLSATAQAELVTVKKDGTGDYTTLSAAVNAIPANITGDPQEPYTIRITGTWSNADETAVTIADCTADATNYIYIYTDSTARHNGKWDENAYRLVVSVIYNGCLRINEQYVTVEGLQIENTGSKTEQAIGIYIRPSSTTSSDVRISHNIVRATGSGTSEGDCTGIRIYNSFNHYIWNNIVYDYYEGIKIAYYQNQSTESIIYNNTAVDNAGYGIQNGGGVSAATLIFYNNLCNGNETDYNLTNVDASGNNISEDDTSPDGASYQYKTVTFVDSANDDFRLSSQDSAAKNQGTSSVSPINFTDDIQGQSRNWGSAGGAWDIGADENVGVRVRVKGGVRIKGGVKIGAY